MSYGREIKEEMMINNLLKEWDTYEFVQQCIKDKVWVNKNGDKVSIASMEDSYIHNCINLLSVSLDEYADTFIKVFRRELKDRKQTP